MESKTKILIKENLKEYFYYFYGKRDVTVHYDYRYDTLVVWIKREVYDAKYNKHLEKLLDFEGKVEVGGNPKFFSFDLTFDMFNLEMMTMDTDSFKLWIRLIK